MAKSSSYTSKQPDRHGFIHYTEEENRMWGELMARQFDHIPGRVCDEYIAALDLMDFPRDRVPQLAEISEKLRRHTGWEVAPVPALIGFTEFFELLANRKFPAATFIRRREDNAAFTEAYGKAGLRAEKRDHAMLARLFWFTVEFGLINTAHGLRSYGAGIVSSPGELDYALESDIPQRKPFDPLDALRTPYRIDIFQTVYFVIDNYDTLYDLAKTDLPGQRDRLTCNIKGD
jgi:phenylalanine-4-hydroxylase